MQLPHHPNGTVRLTDDVAVDITIINYGSWIKKVRISLSLFRLLMLNSIRMSFRNVQVVVPLKM